MPEIGLTNLYKNSIIVVSGIRTIDLKLKTPHKYNIIEVLIE
jgi:hypothetical protein